MATSRLTIANAALAEIGGYPLEFATPADAAAFTAGGVLEDQDDDQARVAGIYPQVRAKLLNAYPWSWLVTRSLLREVPAGANLALGSGGKPSEWPYRYRYAVPNAQIGSIRAVWDTDDTIAGEPRTDMWTVQGAYLFADFRPAWIDSQGDAAEESWPQLFVNAVTLMMAARLVMAEKEDLPTMQAYLRMAERELEEAKRVDAQSKPQPALPVFDWVESRLGGFRGYPVG